MNALARWSVLALVLVVCVAAGLGSYALAQYSWNAVVEYRSPYADSAIPSTRPEAAEASRTVLVIIDGLRLDASRSMGTLQALRGSGRDLELLAPQPSLSYPNWTTILSGAPPYVSGVVTNWHEGASPVETVFDTARAVGVSTAFVGPRDFDELYGVSDAADSTFMLEWDHEYLSDRYVDKALTIADKDSPRLLVVHLPDVDEAGHAFGGASVEYETAVRRVDADLGRLVNGMQDGATVFVVVSDHGHIDTGGHGGWEGDVVTLPCVIAGPDIALGEGSAQLEDVAPTVATLAGIPVPRHALGEAMLPARAGVTSATTTATASSRAENLALLMREVLALDVGADASSPADEIARLQTARLASDRRARLPLFALALAIAAVALALIRVASRPACLAATAGALAYHAIYNAAFFLAHGYRWSLSAFNSEDRIEAWMNGRLIEAALAMVLAAGVAALVYPFLRSEPKRPSGRYLAGWLTLGPVTALVVLVTIGLQVGWFAWWWGVVPEWRLPDLMWGFKYDLDLIQGTAVGLAAVVTPLVSYLVGRYHPSIDARRHEG